MSTSILCTKISRKHTDWVLFAKRRGSIQFPLQHLHSHMECEWSSEWWHFVNVLAVGYHNTTRHLRNSIPRARFIGQSPVRNATWSKLDVSSTWLETLSESVVFIQFTLCRRKIMDSLNPNTSYEELISVRLAGMMLVIIVRQELRKNVLRYSTQSVGTGALNFWVIINRSPLINENPMIIRFVIVEIGQQRWRWR